MNNTAGLSLAIGASLAHYDLYCLSDFSEQNLLSAFDSVKPLAASLFPAHIAWICRYPHLDDYDLSSLTSVTYLGSALSPIYEREIFDKLPNLLFLNNVRYTHFFYYTIKS